MTPEQLSVATAILGTHTLVGEFCDSVNFQHVVHYGPTPILAFYALVEKEDRLANCRPVDECLQLCQRMGVPHVQFELLNVPSFERLKLLLKDLVEKIQQMDMHEGGEGKVLYISALGQNAKEDTVAEDAAKQSETAETEALSTSSSGNPGAPLLLKVKTLEYRVYRKLREKLKIFLEKHHKDFSKLLRKFEEEVAELAREFHLVRPLDNYVRLAKRAFELAQPQTKPIARYVNNRFAEFIQLLIDDGGAEEFAARVEEAEGGALTQSAARPQPAPKTSLE